MVMAFKKQIESGKQHLFRQYENIDQFEEALEGQLARWQRDHEGGASELSIGAGSATTTNAPPYIGAPGFAYWVAEAIQLLEADTPEFAGSLFCDELLARFGTATELALREQVAKALNNKSFRLVELANREEALAVCDDLLARFGSATELALREQVASALLGKGVSLGALHREEEELAIYDELLARFGTATELALREQVNRALALKERAVQTRGRPTS